MKGFSLDRFGPSSGLRLAGTLALLCVAVSLSGCHSAFVQATVVNQTGAPIRLFEVDYPSASFGAGELAPGAQFHYRFKILDTGQSKLLWTDAGEHEHTSKGPNLHEGQEGTLLITIGPGGAQWVSHLENAH